jgi:hypothetical protein
MGKLKHETILLGCWITLMLATLGTVYWGAHATTLTLQVTVILLIALLKSAVIIDGFMELWHAGKKWRVLMYGWPVAMSLVIGITLLTK